VHPFWQRICKLHILQTPKDDAINFARSKMLDGVTRFLQYQDLPLLYFNSRVLVSTQEQIAKIWSLNLCYFEKLSRFQAEKFCAKLKLKFGIHPNLVGILLKGLSELKG
jgi:hypothetical protein